MGKLRKFPKKRYLFYYLLGIVDGEGCFSISIKRDKGTKFGYAIDPVFHVTQSSENREVLELLKEALSCGRIEKKSGQPGTLVFVVDNRRLLKEKIIPFFERYGLIAKKKEFEAFKEVVERLERKEHSTYEGFMNLLKFVLSKRKRRKGKIKYGREILEKIKRK